MIFTAVTLLVIHKNHPNALVQCAFKSKATTSQQNMLYNANLPKLNITV